MALRRLALCLAVAVAGPLSADAFVPAFSGISSRTDSLALRREAVGAAHAPSARRVFGLSMQVQDEQKPKVKDPEEITKKYGLEAGIFTALTNKDKSGPDAKELLKKYGSAYLITSISLALVSFSICYVLVDNGVDVGALLAKVGIEADGKAETAGTVAIAYAAHKAASPIRFPPTVALTPLTAKYLFNKKETDDNETSE